MQARYFEFDSIMFIIPYERFNRRKVPRKEKSIKLLIDVAFVSI